MNPQYPQNSSTALSDNEMFSNLMAEWQSPMYAFAWNYLRDTKLARELVIRVLVSFHLQKPGYGAPVVWLFRQLADACRRLSSKAQPEIESDSRIDALMQAIGRLRHEYKVVLLAQQCTSLGISEIAEVMNTNELEAQRMLLSARRMLISMLAEHPRAAAPRFGEPALFAMSSSRA